MNRFIKGMAAGLIVGAAASMALKEPTGKQIRAAKRSVGRSVRAFGRMLEQ